MDKSISGLPIEKKQKKYEVIKPSEKEFSNHHLLHTVKQVNGDIAFKQVYQRSFVIRFSDKVHIPQQYTTDYFCYLLQGEVYVYKTLKQNYMYKTLKQKPEEAAIYKRDHSQQSQAKGIFLTCHKSHQIFGLQEYPLNVAEKLIFEANEGTKIMVFPIDLSLTSFKKIFNMNMVQYRAEMLKKYDFFKQFQIEKLKKIALYSKRCQGQKGQILVKQGSNLTYLIIVISGQLIGLQGGEHKKIFKENMAIGLDEMFDDIPEPCCYEVICLTNCQLMFVPRNHIIKTYKIKYRLQEKQSIQVKQRRPIDDDHEKQKEQQKKQKEQQKHKEIKQQKHKEIKIQESTPQIKQIVFGSQIKQRKTSHNQLRSSTSTYRKHTRSIKQMKHSNLYHQRSQTTCAKKYMKTQWSDPSYLNYATHHNETSQVFSMNANQSRSLGELCLRKFVNRKERRQNCEIMKYLKSNAPELKHNPSKQYALVKPLQVPDCTYIKNLKRKLKKSYLQTEKTYLKTGGPKVTEQKQRLARFSFFFKEDSVQ